MYMIKYLGFNSCGSRNARMAMPFCHQQVGSFSQHLFWKNNIVHKKTEELEKNKKMIKIKTDFSIKRSKKSGKITKKSGKNIHIDCRRIKNNRVHKKKKN